VSVNIIQNKGEATQNIAIPEKILHKIELVRNPKTGKGWVYNLTDDTWMRALNPKFSKGGVIFEGEYLLEAGKKYLVKVDESSWKNVWETYQIFTLQNGEVKTLASWERNNGNYKFTDETLQKHFTQYCLTLPTASQNPGEAVKANVLEFAKYLAKVI
jgi:hypothetical protein